MSGCNEAIKEALDKHLDIVASQLSSEVMAIYGPIGPFYEMLWPEVIEKLPRKKDTLSIIIETGGGSAEIVERLVNITRHHFEKVNFVVPNQAMSAGTIFIMSGDRIYMEYSSVVGPIDPQVMNEQQHWVPALGYLEKYDVLRKKAEADKLSMAEFALLSKMDLAEITQYEQQRELTVTLLKTWLVNYKFKDWTVHETDQAKKGKPVTVEEKEVRAATIADILGKNSEWHTHSRKIDLATLRSKLRLKIDDYSDNNPLRDAIRSYHRFMLEYQWRGNHTNVIHHGNYLTI